MEVVNTVGRRKAAVARVFVKPGESMEWNDFTLEIVDMDGARIDKVLVTLTHKNEEDN